MMKIAFALLLACSVLAAPKKESPAELDLTGANGAKVHLRDLRGKVVVVNFWATWCPPCRHEMPMLVEAEKEWAARGVVFIAASLDDRKTSPGIPEFVAKYEVRYPVWTGATRTDLARLHLGEGAPDTVFIDEAGLIFSRVKGEIRRAEIDDRLHWVLEGRKDPPPAALVDHME